LKELLGIDINKENNIGLSIIKAVEKFFKVYRLGLDVIDERELLIFSYRPEKLNTNISPQIMRVCVHNNRHIELLNNNIESFD